MTTPRLATEADLPEILRLAASMYESMGLDASGEEWRARAHDVAAAGLASGDIAVFVVDDERRPGRLAACGGATVAQRLPGPGNPAGLCGYVQWMVSDAHARRRGHGRAIFAALLRWIASRGATTVELHATPDGERLYRSFGFGDPSVPNMRGKALTHARIAPDMALPEA